MAESTSTPIVRVHGLVSRFGSQVVHDGLDLEVRPNEIFGVVGGSGSGKSVLLRTMLGLRRPQGGTVELYGRDIQRLSRPERLELVQSCGVTFQNGALISSLNIAQNIQLPLREYHPMPEEALDELAQLNLGLVGLPPDAAAKYPAQLSGGMTKRAALARALSLEPKLLFLDEPTSGLDPISAAAFDELLLYLHAELKLTVVMITHDLDSLFRTCNRVGVIVEGRMITDTLAGMLQNSHPVDTGLFSRTPGAGRGEAGKRMDRDTNYVAVGAFVLLVIAMAVSFVFWYTDQRDKRTYQRYEIYFQGSVSGLTAGSPVRYLGVDVGKVVRITLEPQLRKRVQVIADIESAAPIDGRTLASLTLQGVTGLLFIDLEEDPKAKGPGALAQGHRYPVIRSAPSDFDVLLSNLPALAARASELVDRLNQVFSDENVHGLQGDDQRRAQSERALARDGTRREAIGGRHAQRLSRSAERRRRIARRDHFERAGHQDRDRQGAGYHREPCERLGSFGSIRDGKRAGTFPIHHGGPAAIRAIAARGAGRFARLKRPVALLEAKSVAAAL